MLSRRRATMMAGAVGLSVAVSTLQGARSPGQTPIAQPLDVIYVPTPEAVVRQMLITARVGPGDVVYDLGSGDGRIPIAAVKEFGATRGVGIDLDPQRIREATLNAETAGVAGKVTFVQQDLFTADLSDATVIAMYLLPAMNARLAPTLRALAPGTRIVSHNYDMGPTWTPAKSFVVGNSKVHFWAVPRRHWWDGVASFLGRRP